MKSAQQFFAGHAGDDMGLGKVNQTCNVCAMRVH